MVPPGRGIKARSVHNRAFASLVARSLPDNLPVLTPAAYRFSMFSHIERPTERPPGPGKILSDFGLLYASSGFIGWLFAATAPVAIILAVGSGGGLSEGQIASWIFGVFFINGLNHDPVLLAVSAAAGILLDHSRHSPDRPIVDASDVCAGRRRLLRHERADARAWGDRFGEARDGAGSLPIVMGMV